jgi:copper(I)-binding protein
MRPLGTRRAVRAAGAAAVAVLALAGCSAGQVAETAILDTPIGGVDTESATGSVYIRNLQVEYPGVHAYEAGASAPLELSLYNQTDNELTVSISTRPSEQAQVVSASQVGIVSAAAVPSGAPSGEPSGAPSEAHSSEPAEAHSSEPAEVESSAPVATPSAPAAKVAPAQFKIPAQGSVLFRPTDAAQLQVIGLSEELAPGTAVNLVFEFSDKSPALEVQAPVANPLTAAPREEGNAEEGEH